MYDSRGQVLIYHLEPEFHLAYTLTPDGIQDVGNQSAARFTNDPVAVGYQALTGFTNVR